MSKYIKLEDAINALYSGFVTKSVIEGKLKDLPTIEVSEEVLKATKNFNAYTIADENAEMGMRTMIEPIIEVSEEQLSKLKSSENSVENTTVSEDFTSISRAKSKLEVSEDCISREYALEVINDCINYPTNGDKACAIKNAPSVVPSRAEGEWIEVDDGRVSCKCSICKEEYLLYEEDVFGRNYCPNCGAKMKKQIASKLADELNASITLDSDKE